MLNIITKIDILFYFGWPAISTYPIVLYGLHGINLLICFLHYYLILYNYICCLVNAEIKYFSLSLSLSLYIYIYIYINMYISWRLYKGYSAAGVRSPQLEYIRNIFFLKCNDIFFSTRNIS